MRNEASVRELFAHLASGQPERFFEHVAEDVHWYVLGTQPLAGEYHSKQEFQQATFARLAPLFEGHLKLFTRDVLVNGDRAAVELYTDTTAKSGLPFRNEYCWICRFEGDKIVEVRAYLDSALVAEVMQRSNTH